MAKWVNKNQRGGGTYMKTAKKYWWVIAIVVLIVVLTTWWLITKWTNSDTSGFDTPKLTEAEAFLVANQSATINRVTDPAFSKLGLQTSIQPMAQGFQGEGFADDGDPGGEHVMSFLGK